jgi:phosphatidylglycerophosphate synthase
MDLSRLLTTFYYFDTKPGGDFLIGFLLLAFFITIIFTESFLKKIAEENKYLKKSFKKKLWPFPYLGALGIILILFRFAKVPFFSMRAFLYANVILILAIGIYSTVRVWSEYTKRTKSVKREKGKRN